MPQSSVPDMKLLTRPFAKTWEHVQGPGGNTSVKNEGTMLIKASGFTFKDVTNGTGLTWINPNPIIEELAENYNNNSLESPTAQVQKSIPEGLRPSMEFEFHAALDTYVLHTHSIYVNVITCSQECSSLLAAIFPNTDYILVPYIMPGRPLASYIYKTVKNGNKAKIYFLKNHGIIVHGETIAEVISTYHLIQERIINFLNLNTIFMEDVENGIHKMPMENVSNHILVPDQSIFFRNKTSDTNRSADIFFDLNAEKIQINGSPKFIETAKDLLKMVYYITNNHQRLSLTSEFISERELQTLHKLSSEKYRVSILK